MNIPLLAAAISIVAIVLIHSALGQRRIFDKLHNAVPSFPLNTFQIGILWASWHLVSVFGLALAAGIAHLGLGGDLAGLDRTLRWAAVAAMTAGACLVARGTRGRHPAWLGMLLIAALVASVGTTAAS